MENTTLNTQSQEKYVNPRNLRKGFTPTINKALMRRRELILYKHK